MFTGIIEAAGKVAELTAPVRPALESAGRRLVVRAQLAAELHTSDSIALNGVCLTVLASDTDSFRCDLSPETLQRTNLGALVPGSLVNLERPLTLNTPLGGHLVQGHVDGVSEVFSYRPLDAEGNYWLEARVPAELLRYVAWKGSVALNGISFTGASLEGEVLGVAVVPYTHTHTNLHACQPGDQLNLECDLVARYLERLLLNLERPAEHPAERPAETLTVDRLIQEGF